MELRVLEYFLMVAREENITKAAKQLHISQPTLSRQILALEKELGVKLFERSKYSVYLTTEGMLFRRRAQEIINLSEKAKQEVSQNDNTLSGEISIGCGEFLSVNELTGIIAKFRTLYPYVTFHLYSSHNIDIQSKLEQGLLDLGLLMEPVDVTKYQFIRMKEKEQWGILTKTDSPFATKESIKPGELVGTPVITIPDEMVHNELVSWSGDYAKYMEMGMTYNLLYNATIACKNTGMPVVCIKLDCEYPDLKFVPFEPELNLSTILVWKEHQIKSKAITTFIEFLKMQ